MSSSVLAYRSDSRFARKGWADFDHEVRTALRLIGRPATFDEVADRLPAGIHYRLILDSLRASAEYTADGWQVVRSAAVVELPKPVTATNRKAA